MEITYKRACELIQESAAVIVDDTVVAFAQVNEDHLGEDIIEISGRSTDAEYTFTEKDAYSLDGRLTVVQRSETFVLDFLKCVEVKA